MSSGGGRWKEQSPPALRSMLASSAANSSAARRASTSALSSRPCDAASSSTTVPARTASPTHSREQGQGVRGLGARGAHAHAISLDSRADDLEGEVLHDLAGHVAVGHTADKGAVDVDGGAGALQPAAVELLLAQLQLARRPRATDRGCALENGWVAGARGDGRGAAAGQGWWVWRLSSQFRSCTCMRCRPKACLWTEAWMPCACWPILCIVWCAAVAAAHKRCA